jgi:hypothetical protein
MLVSGRLLVLIPAILTALLLSGCGAGEDGLTTARVAASPQPKTGVLPGNGDIEPTGPGLAGRLPPTRETFVGTEVLSQGQNLRHNSPQPLFRVITTQQTLRSFWQTYLSQGATTPQVDFQRSFVLAGIQGVKPTGGYSISFTGLEQDGNEVRVITEWTEPAGTDSVDMTFTQPYTVLRVDSTLLTSKGALFFVFETGAGRKLGRVAASIQ